MILQSWMTRIVMVDDLAISEHLKPSLVPGLGRVIGERNAKDHDVLQLQLETIIRAKIVLRVSSTLEPIQSTKKKKPGENTDIAHQLEDGRD